MTALSIFTLSAFVTYWRHDISELYSLMGYPEAEITRLKEFTFLQGHKAAWFTLVVTLPLLGYMLYIERFFPHQVENSEQ